jgi:mannose-6-phosphate isomerase-like protein (cupin superfamily)
VEAGLSGPAWSVDGLHRFRELRVRLVALADRVGIGDPGLEAFELAPTTADGVTAGTAVLFTGPRPGVRIERPDGTLFLTVMDRRERDAVAASLARVAGLPPLPSLIPSNDPAPDAGAGPGSPWGAAVAAQGAAPRRPVLGPEAAPLWPEAAPLAAAPPSSNSLAQPPAPGGPAMQTSDLTDVRRQLDAAGKPFIEFVRSTDLSVGLFVLPAGGIDSRPPHAQDVVYHVTAGRARVVMGEIVQVVGPGSVVYVRAGTEHRFAAIESELSALVVFGPAQAPSARDGG